MSDLKGQILTLVPVGPIRIVGYSIGGHLGYALALRLLDNGRDVAGFCAIDSFMIEALSPSVGWEKRALHEGLELLRKGDVGEVFRFIRSKGWRALLRLAPDAISKSLDSLLVFKGLPSIIAFDRVLEAELATCYLVRKAAPWLQMLDQPSVALTVPTNLLRTEQNSRYDAAWRRRCPNIEITEIAGKHSTLLNSIEFASLREALRAVTCRWG